MKNIKLLFELALFHVLAPPSPPSTFGLCAHLLLWELFLGILFRNIREIANFSISFLATTIIIKYLRFKLPHQKFMAPSECFGYTVRFLAPAPNPQLAFCVHLLPRNPFLETLRKELISQKAY